MAGELIHYAERGSVGMITLDAPPRNEMTFEMFDRLGELLEGEVKRDEPRGLVINSSGRHFSSGADVGALERSLAPGSDVDERLFFRHLEILLEIEQGGIPVVAAVSGACLGAGMELALACNYRVASPSAIFGLPESEFGLMPGCGGAVRLAGLIGKGRAVDMILSGRRVLADEAARMGLVDLIAERSTLAETAMALATRMAGIVAGEIART